MLYWIHVSHNMKHDHATHWKQQDSAVREVPAITLGFFSQSIRTYPNHICTSLSSVSIFFPYSIFNSSPRVKYSFDVLCSVVFKKLRSTMEMMEVVGITLLNG